MNKQFSHIWRLRLTHHGFSHIQMDWRGGAIHFNPLEAVGIDDVIVLLGSWPEQLIGVVRHLEIGLFPKVIAPESLRTWLIEKGWPSDRVSSSCDENGLSIVLERYIPIPFISPKEAIHKMVATLKGPLAPLRRLRELLQNPVVDPQLAWVTFPSGKKFVHLNCSLHKNQKTDWVSETLERVNEVTWVIVGADYEEHSFCAEMIPKITSEHILLTDLVGDYRRKAGLPTELLTPLADKVISQDRHVHLFPTQVTHRFDNVQLV